LEAPSCRGITNDVGQRIEAIGSAIWDHHVAAGATFEGALLGFVSFNWVGFVTVIAISLVHKDK
jgi:hypothetical protein